MIIAKCRKCGKKYELKPDEKLSDFQCGCGGELKFHYAIDVEYDENKEPKREIISNSRGYDEKMSDHLHNTKKDDNSEGFMYNKILLPTDGSKYAYEAAKHAIWAANSSKADIIVLNVVELPKRPELNSEDIESKLNILREEGKIALDEVSQLLDKSWGEINASFIIKEGSPARIILQTIKDNNIDLVVMGTSGKSDLDKLLMGSVAEKIVQNAKCAVTIIH